MPVQGPAISINLNNAEMLLKLGDLVKAAKAAKAEIREIEKAAAKAEAQGLKLDKSTTDRLKRAEKVYDTATSRIDAADAATARNTGRNSYAFQKYRSQFEHDGGGIGRHMGLLKNPTPEGLISAGAQVLGGQAAVRAIQEVLKIPDTIRAIRTTIEDDARRTAGSLSYVGPLERLRRQKDTEESVLGQIPVIGGVLAKGNEVGTTVRRLFADEENDATVNARVANEDAFRRLGLGGARETAAAVKARENAAMELWARVTNSLSPAEEKLTKDREQAEKLLAAGIAEATKGNIVGDLLRGGEGGANVLFAKANQLLPGIAPQNASATYQAIEQGRIADRNFARSQMTRAGPRTGD